MSEQNDHSLRKTIQVHPSRRTLNILSQEEIERMCDHTLINQYHLFRRCALAVLNCENKPDNINHILNEERYSDFEIEIKQLARGVCIELTNAPIYAFVEERLIEGVRENLFAVLRDLIYVNSEIYQDVPEEADPSTYTTNQVFHILRNAKALKPNTHPNLVVCWGGHNISQVEYDYTKEVGYEFGLRGLDVITGCGNGAMKGPMKGATIGSAIQRNHYGRYIGITEPGIIASESPNPIVNHLVIMPDIEKRLEAFIRTGHAVVQFPGGVGSAEELFFMLGILSHPQNEEIPYPFILTGPANSEEYFAELHDFVGNTLGKKAQALYQVIVNDPKKVAQEVAKGISKVKEYRSKKQDAYHFNWMLKTHYMFQEPFHPSHENMSQLHLSTKLPSHELASEIRKTFSGIVAGNVKNPKIIEEQGPYEINGEKKIIEPLKKLLNNFEKHGRMKSNSKGHDACYTLNIV